MKPVINLVFAGHVDHGKSTLVGRLLYELGKIPEQTLVRLRRHAEALGKETFYFAFYTDRSLEERQRGISIEVAFLGFETENRRFNIIDAPGHKDFVKNMITGATEADAAVLVVDTEATANRGLQPQTKEHLILLDALGIEQLIVALNKMDVVEYSSDAFEYTRLELQEFLEQNNYTFQGDIPYIPISAYHGENITKPSAKTPWYHGPTLLDTLDALREPLRIVDRPLRMPLLRAFNVPGIGAVLAGKIESGRIQLGDRVVVVPYPGAGMAGGEVKSIEWQHRPVDVARAGDDVGILLTRVDRGFVARQVKKGSIVASPQDPPKEVELFKARLVVIDQPHGIREGYAPYLHCHQAALPCSLLEIEGVLDQETGMPKEKPDALNNGDMANVWIRPHKPLVIEEFNKMPKLGRFVLRDGRTVAAGICLETELTQLPPG